MRMRPYPMAALGSLIAAAPVHAQWTVKTVPGTEGRTYTGVPCVDPTTGDLLVIREGRAERIDPASGKSQVIENLDPGLAGFRLVQLAVAPGGAIDCLWEKSGPEYTLAGSLLFRCLPGQKPQHIAGKKDSVLFKGTSPLAAAHALAPNGWIYGPSGEIFMTSQMDDRVFMLYPLWKPETRKTPGQEQFGIRVIAGTGRRGHGMSGAERAAALAEGKSDALKVPITPSRIALTATGDILFTDQGYHRVFHLIPPGGERRHWTLESKAGSGEDHFNGGDHARASDANLRTPSQITIGTKGQVYVNTAERRIWEFTSYEDKGHAEWRSRVLTFAGAGPDGKDTEILPGVSWSMTSLPGGRLAIVSVEKKGIRILTPPPGDPAAMETKGTKPDGD